MSKEDYKHWLPDSDYQKAIGQARLQIGSIMSPLRLYGQSHICDQALEEIMIIVEQFGKRVRGRDVPIAVIRKRK